MKGEIPIKTKLKRLIILSIIVLVPTTVVYAIEGEEPVEEVEVDVKAIEYAEKEHQWFEELEYETQLEKIDKLAEKQEKEKEKAREEEMKKLAEKKAENDRIRAEEEARLEAERKEKERQEQARKEQARKEQARKEQAEREQASTRDNKKVQTTSDKQGTNIGTFQATAFAVGDGYGVGTKTADGTDISNTIYSPEGYRIIATDPNVIPLGTIVRVTLPNGESFIAKASDTGGLIKGNIIDILLSSPAETVKFGRQNGIKVEVLK